MLVDLVVEFFRSARRACAGLVASALFASCGPSDFETPPPAPPRLGSLEAALESASDQTGADAPSPSYWSPSESDGNRARIAFDWIDSGTLSDVFGRPVALGGVARLVPDGPYNRLWYARGTLNFSALDLNAPPGGAAFATHADVLCDGGPGAGRGADLPYTAFAFVFQNETAGSGSSGGSPTPEDGAWDTVLRADRLFELALEPGTGAVRFGVWNEPNGAFAYYAAAGAKLRRNEWHSLRAVYDAGRISLYVDERRVSAGHASAPMRLPGSAYHAGCHDLSLGDASSSAALHGRISGVWAVRAALHPRVEDARRRVALDMDGPFRVVQNGFNAFELLNASYTKLGDRRVVFYTRSGAGAGPTVDPSNPRSAISSKVFELGAGDRPVIIPDDTLRYLTQATYEAWIYRSRAGSTAEAVLGNDNFGLSVLPNATLQCRFRDAIAPMVKPVAVSRTAIELGTWYHVACSFDGVSTRVWVNGVNEATARVESGSPGFYAHLTGNLEIGRADSGGFAGKLTGIQVWDRARTPEGGPCSSQCTRESAPDASCYDVRAQAASTCGSYNPDMSACAALCTPASECNASCGSGMTCGDYVQGGNAVCNVERARAHSTLLPRSDRPGMSDRSAALAPGPGGFTAEVEMTGGRLSRVPVSYAWMGQVAEDITGRGALGTDVWVRASCSTPNAAADACDPGLVLIAVDPALDTELRLRPKAAAVTLVQHDNNANGGPLLSGVYDDSNVGSGTTPQSAQVSINVPGGTTRRIYALVYAANRGTALVDINWTTSHALTVPAFDTWKSFTCPFSAIGANGGDRDCNAGQQRAVVAGGTLLKLGPVESGDTFQVRTQSNGSVAQDQTRLWLFNPSRSRFFASDSMRRALSSSLDWDPTFTFDAGWVGTSATTPSETFALVARSSSEVFTPGSAYPESFVDVVHTASFAPEQEVSPEGWPAELLSPHRTAFDRIWANSPGPRDPGPDDFIDTSGAYLAPGRYLLSVFALPGVYGAGVGEFPDMDGERHDTSENEDLNDDCNGDDGASTRGQGNDLAFVMEVNVAGRRYERYVPRAVLGDRLGYSRVTMHLEIPDLAGIGQRVTVSLRDLGAGIKARGAWSFRKNVEAVSLTSASLNLEYKGLSIYTRGQGTEVLESMQRPGDVKNAIRFLGTGPRYVPGSREVRFHENQGAWSFEADIIGMNEIMARCGGFDRTLAMFEELNLNAPGADFTLAYGRGTTNNCLRANPLYVRGSAASSAGVQNISTAGVHDCGIGPLGGVDCYVTDGGHFWDGDYYATIARAAFKAHNQNGSATERPITVVQFYLPPDKVDLSERRHGRSELRDQLTELLAANPLAFNASGSTDPLDAGNRIVIQGDSNMYNSQCAESNGWVNVFRERFGYALDASMAAVDERNQTFDMHYGTAPLSPWSYFDRERLVFVAYSGLETGTFYTRVGAQIVGLPPKGGPFNWVRSSAWSDDSQRSYADEPVIFKDGHMQPQFAWWKGMSSAHGGGGSRLDMVLLVGRGWADDDPVQAYGTVANAEEGLRNSSSRFTRGSVDIRTYCLGRDTVVGSVPSESYVPDYLDVCEQGGVDPEHDTRAANGAGALAFRTDHKPLMLRLRSLLRR